MKYELEELLPIVAKLTRKYTSNESSSVPYETARILMEAVIYCLEEYEEKEAGKSLPMGEKLKAETAYELGCGYVVEKVHQAKETYEEVIVNFEDYGCKNYSDTIAKGIPAFFTRYDAKYNPQNHLLTLDYPTMFMSYDKSGVNLILEYLEGIDIEKCFLDLFDRNDVIALLEKIQPEYQSLYLDNICNPVLLHAIGCIIADKPIRTLEIEAQDCRKIKSYFENSNCDTIEIRLNHIIQLMMSQIGNDKVQTYFLRASREYAVRIWNALQNDSLDGIFITTNYA